MAKPLTITEGQVFNFLTVIKEAESKNRKRRFTCKCKCGTVREFDLILLTTQQAKNCGCYRIETFVTGNTFHGKSRTKLSAVWQAMKQRCENSNNINFHNYGGRGIKICTEWLNSLESFYDWAIDNGYSEGLTLDREDVNGNYEPSNCRWVTMKVQTRNKRDNVFIEHGGKNLCISDWAKTIGIKECTLKKRINNWGIDRALTTSKIIKNDTKSNRYG
jgi:hypothetical protein